MNTIHKELIIHIFSFLCDKDVIRLSRLNTTFRDIIPHYMGLTNIYSAECLSVKRITINNISEENDEYRSHADNINTYHNKLHIEYYFFYDFLNEGKIICDPKHILTVYVYSSYFEDIIRIFLDLLTNEDGIFHRADMIFIVKKFSLDVIEDIMKKKHNISIYEFFKAYRYNVKTDSIRTSSTCTSPISINKKDKSIVLGNKLDNCFFLDTNMDYVFLENTYYCASYCKNSIAFIKGKKLETSITNITSLYHDSKCGCTNDVTHVDLSCYVNLTTFYYEGDSYKHAITASLTENVEYITIYNATVPIIKEYPINVVRISTDSVYGIKDLIMRRNISMNLYITLVCGVKGKIDITYTRTNISILMYNLDEASLDICEELLSIEFLKNPIVKILSDNMLRKKHETFLEISKWIASIRYEYDHTKYPRLVRALKNNQLFRKAIADIFDM